MLTGLLTLSAFFTAVISATVGMAGGIVLLAIMSFFMPLTTLIPLHGVVQLISNSSRSLALFNHINWKIFSPMLIGLPLGTYSSSLVLREIHNKEIFYFLVAALIFYALFKPKKMPSLKIPYWGFFILGLAVGFLNPLVGATGPFQAPFFLRDDLTKHQLVATKAISQTLGHILKIPLFLSLDFIYQEHQLLLLLMGFAVIVGTRFGVQILHRIDEKLFTKIFKTALFFAGLRVLFKAISSVV